LSAYILANYLAWEFVDAVDVIHFHRQSVNVQLPQLHKNIIVPGFYGHDAGRNTIAVFPRGGSDITGSYIAAAYRATLYENWTDVSGVYTHDPRKEMSATPIALLSYTVLEKIGRNGACVFHPDAIHPVAKSRIPIHIKNTFAPDEPGTLVQQSSS
jgi:aspartate kinase